MHLEHGASYLEAQAEFAVPVKTKLGHTVWVNTNRASDLEDLLIMGIKESKVPCVVAIAWQRVFPGNFLMFVDAKVLTQLGPAKRKTIDGIEYKSGYHKVNWPKLERQGKKWARNEL